VSILKYVVCFFCDLVCLLLQQKKSFGLFSSRRSVKGVEGRSRNLLVSAQEYVEYHSQHFVMALLKLDDLLMKKYQRVCVCVWVRACVCVCVCACMCVYSDSFYTRCITQFAPPNRIKSTGYASQHQSGPRQQMS